MDKAIALNPKLDFVSASQVNELSSIINAPRIIKPVEPESNWFIWLFGSACISFLFFQFMSKRKKSSKLSTPDIKPSTKYSPSSEHTSTAKPAPVNPTNGRSYSEPPKEAPSRPVYNRTSSYEPTRTSRPAEVHHHHSASKSDLITTLATAGLTAAAVSYMMDDKPEQPTHSYQPEPISSSWNDDSSTSSTWDSPSESTSSSWNDDSSSSSDSWSDSSSSSDSNSSWND